MTLPSSMAMYSVMRDKHDARSIPMETGWVALYLCATYKYSNELTLEQWALENGLLFLYAKQCSLFHRHCYGKYPSKFGKIAKLRTSFKSAQFNQCVSDNNLLNLSIEICLPVAA